MHVKLHKRGMLLLPIIIPETDLNHLVIDLDFDVDSSVPGISVCSLPNMEPNHPESSLCDMTPSDMTPNKDVLDDEEADEDDADGDEEGETSQ